MKDEYKNIEKKESTTKEARKLYNGRSSDNYDNKRDNKSRKNVMTTRERQLLEEMNFTPLDVLYETLYEKMRGINFLRLPRLMNQARSQAANKLKPCPYLKVMETQSRNATISNSKWRWKRRKGITTCSSNANINQLT